MYLCSVVRKQRPVKMNKAEELIKELKPLVALTDEKSMNRKNEIVMWFKENNTPENVRLFQGFLKEGMEGDYEAVALRKQIHGEDYNLLPMSYIAKHYFKKSAAWLCQRINGTPVRGKVYTLNDEQKKIFNHAVEEIGKRIGSLRLT